MIAIISSLGEGVVRPSQTELAQQREPHPIECPDLAAGNDGASGLPEALDVLQLETLMLNLDASLRVHERAHFFSWTQGLLQSLIRHEVLICALRSGEPLSFRVDSFSTIAPDPAIFGEMFLREASVAPSLIKAWEERRFRPVTCEAGNGSQFAGGAFARELERTGATQLFAHGTHDADGQVTSFFTFACMPGTIGSKQVYLAQLAVPFLHSAWVRTQINGRTKGSESVKPAEASNVTAREQEILRWIYLGKSNFEIGAILNISPLTVKNHVQKILRKLNVVNRAQAVGKALELRILKP
jgi:transcriptional regulator EpsA